MTNKKVRVGELYGRLRVIESAPSDNHGNAYFLCRCECGKEKLVRGSHLRSGSIRSCGCYRSERMRNLNAS